MNIMLELRFVLMVGLPIWIVIRVTQIFKKKKQDIKINVYEEILTNIFVLYFLILIGITIFPIYIGEPMEYLKSLSFIERCNINILPFTDYFRGGLYLRTVVRILLGNFLLLVPFIMFLCAKKEKMRNLKSCTITALLISVTIEFTQLITNLLLISGLRTVNIEDLILNTLGGVLAYYIFKLTYRGKFKIGIDSMKEELILDTV